MDFPPVLVLPGVLAVVAVVQMVLAVMAIHHQQPRAKAVMEETALVLLVMVLGAAVAQVLLVVMQA